MQSNFEGAMNQKNKMVSFRISHGEYTRLRDACNSVGARNISELARAAMHRMIESDSAESFGLQGQVLGLRSKLDDVAHEVDRLARAVGSR